MSNNKKKKGLSMKELVMKAMKSFVHYFVNVMSVYNMSRANTLA